MSDPTILLSPLWILRFFIASAYGAPDCITWFGKGGHKDCEFDMPDLEAGTHNASTIHSHIFVPRLWTAGWSQTINLGRGTEGLGHCCWIYWLFSGANAPLHCAVTFCKAGVVIFSSSDASKRVCSWESLGAGPFLLLHPKGGFCICTPGIFWILYCLQIGAAENRLHELFVLPSYFLKIFLYAGIKTGAWYKVRYHELFRGGSTATICGAPSRTGLPLHDIQIITWTKH